MGASVEMTMPSSHEELTLLLLLFPLAGNQISCKQRALIWRGTANSDLPVDNTGSGFCPQTPRTHLYLDKKEVDFTKTTWMTVERIT